MYIICVHDYGDLLCKGHLVYVAYLLVQIVDGYAFLVCIIFFCRYTERLKVGMLVGFKMYYTFSMFQESITYYNRLDPWFIPRQIYGCKGQS